MCTNDEVREAVIKTRLPTWFPYTTAIISGAAVLFIGWLAFTVHEQPEHLERELGLIRLNNAVLNAELAGQIASLSEQVKDLKGAAGLDRYTGTDALARNNLVDERHIYFDRRLTANEIDIRELKSEIIYD